MLLKYDPIVRQKVLFKVGGNRMRMIPVDDLLISFARFSNSLASIITLGTPNQPNTTTNHEPSAGDQDAQWQGGEIEQKAVELKTKTYK